MSAKQAIRRRSFWGGLIVVVLVIAAALLLAPNFATLMGRFVANLWVTVMGAVAGILGGLIGS